MKRHIRTTAFVLSAMAAVLAAPVAHTEQRKLNLSTNSPPNHWSSEEAFVPFMTCVTDRTAGAIGFEYFPSSQLASTTDSLSAVNSGLAEISYLALSALSDSMPISGISMLPDMGDSATEMATAFRRALSEDGPLADEFRNNRVHPLLIIMTPPYQVIMRSEPVRSPDDFAGKKLRVSGAALSLAVSTLGGAPVEMPPSDIYVAMQQGLVDGTVLSLPSLPPYSLQEVAGAASRNATLGGATAVLAIDTTVWDGLGTNEQEAMTECGAELESHINHYVDELNDTLAEEFRSVGVEIFDLTDAELKNLSTALAPVRENYVMRVGKRGLPAQEALEQYLHALGR